MKSVESKYADTMQNLMIVMSCFLFPMTYVQCERGFSTQNRMKSKLRTNLNNQTLND